MRFKKALAITHAYGMLGNGRAKMSPQKKHVQREEDSREETRIRQSLDSDQSHPSPARQLQSRLHAQLSPEILPVWSRYVTLFLAFTLAGAWML